MPGDLLLRTTIADDLPVIVKIYGDAVRTGTGSFELEAPDLALMTTRWRKRVAKGYPHIVALRDTSVIGFAYASRFRSSPAYTALVEDSIYVAPDAQGMGAGGILLADLIERCERLGFKQMIALIAGDNAASVGLHSRFGFREIGSIENAACKHGQWINTLLMQRALSASPPDGG